MTANELWMINRVASVVEYTAARELLVRVGLMLRREGDGLLVFNAPEGSDYNPVYATPEAYPEDKVIGRLYVDEGCFTDTQDRDGVLRYNRRWEELVDATSLMGIVARKLIAGHIIEPSPYMGQRRSQRHAQAQHAVALETWFAEHPAEAVKLGVWLVGLLLPTTPATDMEGGK